MFTPRKAQAVILVGAVPEGKEICRNEFLPPHISAVLPWFSVLGNSNTTLRAGYGWAQRKAPRSPVALWPPV